MIDYYQILGVKSTASASEVKSAYRRLARQRHPDVNGGSEKAAREFALIALAYRTLSDPQERAYYDARRASGDSVIHSSNPHAQRMRTIRMQARMNKVVDRLIEEQRRETFLLQQAVFTTVSLFLSTFFATMLKPRLWQSFDHVGRAIMFTLFLIGLWHLTARLRSCFNHYTYQPKQIRDSLMHDEENPEKPFTRFAASAFLVVGYVVCVAAGLLVGEHMHDMILSDMPFFFDPTVRPELIFYPPIAVLIIDTMHTVATKID